jgi:hypothetical protein
MARIVLCMSNVPGRLHHRPSSQPSGKAFGEMLATGAVIVGRRTSDLARGRGGDQHPEDELTAGTPDVLSEWFMPSVNPPTVRITDAPCCRRQVVPVEWRRACGV